MPVVSPSLYLFTPMFIPYRPPNNLPGRWGAGRAGDSSRDSEGGPQSKLGALVQANSLEPVGQPVVPVGLLVTHRHT